MLELNGEINDKGVATIFNRKELEDWFVKNSGKRFKIKVERRYKKRSEQQSRYYWGVVIPLIRERLKDLGNEFSSQDTHEALKAKFNTGEIKNESGVQEEFVLSTAKLRTVEFMEYLDKIQRWANEFLGLVIPLPNEQLKIDSVIIVEHDKEVGALIAR